MLVKPALQLSSLLVLALASAASALVRAPTSPQTEHALSVSLSGPEYVRKIQDLKVVATITNTGSETLRILQDPNTILSDAPTEKFSVVNKRGEGEGLTFIGMRVLYSPKVAAQQHEYMTLGPGLSLQIEHDLSRIYDFSSSSGRVNGGSGTYTIHPNKIFHIVDPTERKNVLQLHADAGDPHVMQITDMGMRDIQAQTPFNTTLTELPGADSESYIDDDDTEFDTEIDTSTESFRPNFRNCPWSNQQALTQAAQVAQTNINGAGWWLRTRPHSNPRYTTWFGWFDRRRYNTVYNGFRKMMRNPATRYTYDCRCTLGPSTYAYVYPNVGKSLFSDPVILACASLRRLGHSRNGIIIHEASHFYVNAGTRDIIYGVQPAKNLAARNPWSAINNAANFAYFGENRG
ncbi:zincin [Agrocybe pediades]|nr:zincin [Agrocybe pediades]